MNLRFHWNSLEFNICSETFALGSELVSSSNTHLVLEMTDRWHMLQVVESPVRMNSLLLRARGRQTVPNLIGKSELCF